MKSILIVEDDLPIAKLIRTYISFAGYEASIAPDGERALLMPVSYTHLTLPTT